MLSKYFLNLHKKFKNSNYSKELPILSPSILLFTTSFLILNRNSLKNPLSFIFERNENFKLEKKERNSILFDYRNFLSSTKFDLSKFDFFHMKRNYSEEFLFYLAQYYELICVSDGIPLISNKEIKEIDPLGCISYKIFINNKKDLRPEDLNRKMEKLTIISTQKGEFNEQFDRNVLEIQKFQKNDNKLLDLVHFFTNLHFSNVSDVRNVLSSYKNSDFFSSFRTVQETLYKQRNLFSFEDFGRKLEEVNKKKIRDYQIAKERIVIKEDNREIKELIMRFIKGVLL